MEVLQTFVVECNTSDEVIRKNIAENSKRQLPLVKMEAEHDGHAIIVGSGPSLADTLDAIRWRKSLGQKVFALNGAAKFLRENDIEVDYTVMVDAREENLRFVGWADHYLLSSQCSPVVVSSVENVTLWHPVTNGMEDAIHETDAEYALIGGGTTVGLSAMCLVYALGYRKMHLFGYDSSHRDKDGHAFEQNLNKNDSLCYVTVDEVRYRASLAMAKQAELFPILSNELIDRGCVITVDGDGLLPAIVRRQEDIPEVDFEVTDERSKYEKMWTFPNYREVAPGQSVAALFCLCANPKRDDSVIDFGAGTGRGALRINQLRGCKVKMLDFAENCLDKAVRDSLNDRLTFQQADLTQELPVKAKFGFCTDVLEHIPPDDVDTVLKNIFASAQNVFFQISTVPDHMGALIGHPLHLTVQPFEWWLQKLSSYGEVSWSSDHADAPVFYVINSST
jgi:SAM-dependent methyltransferase